MLGASFPPTRSNLIEDLRFDWSRDDAVKDLNVWTHADCFPSRSEPACLCGPERQRPTDAGNPAWRRAVRDDLGRKVYSDADGRFTSPWVISPVICMYADSVADVYLLYARCNRR
jgi:hypothetical protein